MYKSLVVVIMLMSTLTLVSTTQAEAAYNCGRFQRAYFGLVDRSLNLALEWARKFEHTAAHAGAVLVQTRRGHDSAGHPGGHVSRVVSVTGQCTAIVADTRGTYERNTCKNFVAFVDPNGNHIRDVVLVSARSHHHRHYHHYARHHGHRHLASR
jgi:ABC-type nickel/cobalt efflux system permease component RcnA